MSEVPGKRHTPQKRIFCVQKGMASLLAGVAWCKVRRGILMASIFQLISCEFLEPGAESRPRNESHEAPRWSCSSGGPRLVLNVMNQE
jgi:hypothetical protein